MSWFKNSLRFSKHDIEGTTWQCYVNRRQAVIPGGPLISHKLDTAWQGRLWVPLWTCFVEKLTSWRTGRFGGCFSAGLRSLMNRCVFSCMPSLGFPSHSAHRLKSEQYLWHETARFFLAFGLEFNWRVFITCIYIFVYLQNTDSHCVGL